MHRPILIAIVLTILWSSDVFAWGHAADFAKEQDKYLIKNVIKNKKIQYCLIQQKGLNVPDRHKVIQAAFKKWLSAINVYGVYDESGNLVDLSKVEITQSDCSDVTVPDGMDMIKDKFAKNWFNILKDNETAKLYTKSIAYNSLKQSEDYDVLFVEDTEYGELRDVGGCCVIEGCSKYLDTSGAKGYMVGVLIVNGLLPEALKYFPTFFYNTIKPVIILAPKKDIPYAQVALHEIGHAFGLADQYYIPEYRLEYADIVDPLYSSTNHIPSLMSAESAELTCDDITSMLFAFDRFANYTRLFSTICKDNEQGIYISSKREGTWILAAADESKKDEDLIGVGKYFNGLKDGTWTATYTDADYGKIKVISTFKAANTVASESYFDDAQHKLHSKATFINDKVAVAESYDKKGTKMKEFTGDEYGYNAIEKYPSGKIKRHAHYNYDRKAFVMEELYENGKVHIKYGSTPRCGMKITYDENGKEISNEAQGSSVEKSHLEDMLIVEIDDIFDGWYEIMDRSGKKPVSSKGFTGEKGVGGGRGGAK
jgi:antitoxin component YwqK of YwqJK toxin-antitoxin module